MSETKPTRAAVAPPPSKAKQSFLPQSARGEEVKPADNMQAKSLVGMTFNMPREWHMQFKMLATQRGVSMHQLLQDIFDEWQRDRRREEAGR